MRCGLAQLQMSGRVVQANIVRIRGFERPGLGPPRALKSVPLRWPAIDRVCRAFKSTYVYKSSVIAGIGDAMTSLFNSLKSRIWQFDFGKNVCICIYDVMPWDPWLSATAEPYVLGRAAHRINIRMRLSVSGLARCLPTLPSRQSRYIGFRQEQAMRPVSLGIKADLFRTLLIIIS